MLLSTSDSEIRITTVDVNLSMGKQKENTYFYSSFLKLNSLDICYHEWWTPTWKKRRIYNVYKRLKSAYETNHDYKYRWIYAIHTEAKIKALSFLKIHDNDLNARSGIILEFFYKHDVHNRLRSGKGTLYTSFVYCLEGRVCVI